LEDLLELPLDAVVLAALAVVAVVLAEVVDVAAVGSEPMLFCWHGVWFGSLGACRPE